MMGKRETDVRCSGPFKSCDSTPCVSLSSMVNKNPIRWNSEQPLWP